MRHLNQKIKDSKKQYDKKESIKKKDIDREVEQELSDVE